jgi:hypothetical protein
LIAKQFALIDREREAAHVLKIVDKRPNGSCRVSVPRYTTWNSAVVCEIPAGNRWDRLTLEGDETE